MDKAVFCETLKRLKQLCWSCIEFPEQLGAFLHSDTCWPLLLLSHLNNSVYETMTPTGIAHCKSKQCYFILDLTNKNYDETSFLEISKQTRKENRLLTITVTICLSTSGFFSCWVIQCTTDQYIKYIEPTLLCLLWQTHRFPAVFEISSKLLPYPQKTTADFLGVCIIRFIAHFKTQLVADVTLYFY